MIAALILSGRANQPAPPLLLFAISFVGVWFLVAFLISRAGGWAALAEHYRATQPFFGTMYRFQAAQMRGGTNYNGCLNFGVDANGLYMVPMAMFRMFHAPLFIPWSEITARPIKLWRIFSFVELRFHRAPNIPVKLKNSLAERFAEASAGRFRIIRQAAARS